MDTRKLLLADASADFCAALAETLGGACEIRISHDGFEAKKLLETYQPDVLVADLALPGLDGLSVLKAASTRFKRPAMLVLTGIRSPYIETAVEQVGADYLVVKPCDLNALAERICDLMEQPKPVVIPTPSMEISLSNMLLSLGVSIGSRGFRCLEVAINLYAKEPRQSVTKILYPAVAKECGGRKEAVERVIRTAIQRAWNRRDDALWRLYFPTCRDGYVARPTNTVFIATLADRLCRQQQSKAQ